MSRHNQLESDRYYPCRLLHRYRIINTVDSIVEEANSTERETALKNGHHFLDHLKATGLGEFSRTRFYFKNF